MTVQTARSAWRRLVDAAHAAAAQPTSLWPDLAAIAKGARSEPFPGQGASATVFAECLSKAVGAFANSAPARRLALAPGLQGMADAVWNLLEEHRAAITPTRIDLDG